MVTTAKQDWVGTSVSAYRIHGASNHSETERETHDYYATDPKTVHDLLERETFFPEIWEPACGEGHISKVLEARGYNVTSTDLIDRGFGSQADFLDTSFTNKQLDIITNPPYRYATEFVEKSLDTIAEGRKVAMFLKLTFLEGKKRRAFFAENPPRRVYVYSERQNCAKNGDFESTPRSAVAYAWFVWVKGFKGNPEICWI